MTTSDAGLSVLIELIHERTGLIYENGRIDIMRDRLASVMAESDFSSYLDYYYFLKYDSQAADEWRRVQTALAVNETYFWREFDQIRVAAQVLVPKIFKSRPGQPVRIWHAACATGEEPYTMAMALNEAGYLGMIPIEIYATDFNAQAIAHAQAGVYRQRSFRSLPEKMKSQYFHPVGSEQYRLNDNIRRRVNFSYLNLLDANAMLAMRNYDMILCRNAFIYFSDQAIRQVARSFFKSLNQPGYLFVAAAESLLRITTDFELVEIDGAFTYVK